MPGVIRRSFDPLLCVAGLWVFLVGCEPGTTTAPQGEVRGLVLVEGMNLAGVVVELSGPQVRSATTDEAGRYSFNEVPSGAYVVSVRSLPDDTSFPATSRTAVVSGAQTITVDFLGNFIRTASIQGTVGAGPQGLSGITVALKGAQSAETLTGIGGAFSFSGLRSGLYSVEISGLPGSVTFPSVRTDVDLSTGQNFLVTFEGIPELTASVVIRSIERRLPDGTSELADPQNIHGSLEVTVTVDRAEDTLSSIELILGSEVVGQQIFVGSDEFPPEIGSGPQPQAPLDIVYLVDTAEFDTGTGTVRFTNGQALLSASLATVEGGPSAWVSSVQVQLRNPDTFTGSVLSTRGTALGDDGVAWLGGDLIISVLPVLYDPSRVVGSVTVDLRRTGGGQLRSIGGTGPAPFSAVFVAEGESGANNVAAYQTPAGATDQLRVVSATYTDGSGVPGIPAVLAEELRLDNVSPAQAAFALPRQSQQHPCCLGNWVGSGFSFSDAVSMGVDDGVGGVTLSVHVGAAALSDEQLAGLPAVTTGSDLPSTMSNSGFRAVAVSWDALQNPSLSPLAPSDGNSLANALGAVFGVDAEAPEIGFNLASVSDRAVNPLIGSAWALEAVDASAGVSSLAARTRLTLLNTEVIGTTAACLFPGGEDCEPTEDSFVRTVPGGVEGYMRLESFVYDRAGNPSGISERTVLRDLTSPSILTLQLPASLVPNAQTTFSALARDNLELHRGWVALSFEDAGGGDPERVPPQAPQVVSVPFDDELTTDASLVQTFPLLAGLERVVESGGIDAPTEIVLPLAAARAIVTDVAGNVTALSSPLVGGAELPTRSFSVSVRGDVEGVSDWGLEVDTNLICRVDQAEQCASSTPGSATLTARARGLGGFFQRPFDRVYFYLLRNGEPEWIGIRLTAEMADGDGPLARVWSWALDWSPPSTAPFGPLTLVAVGVDALGNVLRTLDLTSLAVEGGP